ncbi:hypothetical protein [Methylomarinum vadi]|uniref:hypothetical protein n=1 Tax=Methylomarinum vadi TaxID=438855 RepID=UPI0004DF84FD|nr:hypothetical protein [Methylomarinum vadi]
MRKLANNHSLKLGLTGFSYGDLYDANRLQDLLALFDRSVRHHDPSLFSEYEHYRSCQGNGMDPVNVSELLVKMAPLVGQFVARLFDVDEDRINQVKHIRQEFDTVFVYRNEVVAKLDKHFQHEDAENWDSALIIHHKV